jgi:hypothetical protein
VKYLPLFHHFKAIYQLPNHIIFLVKIVANASLSCLTLHQALHFCHPLILHRLLSLLKACHRSEVRGAVRQGQHDEVQF